MNALPVSELDSLHRWVPWRNELRNGKTTKVPYDAASGAKAKSDNPSTWGAKSAAVQCAKRIVNGEGGGIGFMLGDLGHGWAIGGIDLDTCRANDGSFLPWAMAVLQRFCTYAEISPSGTGAKIFFLYPLTDLPALRALMGTTWGRLWKVPGGGEHPPGIELHIGNRFFTVTAEQLTSCPAELRAVSLDTLRWLIQEAGPALVGKPVQNGHHTPKRAPPRPPENAATMAQRIEAAAAQHPNLAKRWAGDWSGLCDASRSGLAMALGTALKAAGFSFADMCGALAEHADTREWTNSKGAENGGRELRRIFDRAKERAREAWGVPDMSMARTNRRPPPPLPLDKFGETWATWIATAAEAAACPPDYVAVTLLAATSALIGNARWAQATPSWCEPPHLWLGNVGDSGDGKTPGTACIMRDVLPELERRLLGDFPDRQRDWKAAAEEAKAREEAWRDEVKKATKAGTPPPLPPAQQAPPEPQAPRLRQNDVTVEKVASLLANTAPKGLLIVRDELAGWLLGMNNYNDSGRQFWIEAYNGGPYRVERQKNLQPIIIPHLAVAVTGGIQPEKLAELFRDPDDGLLARILWVWPEPLPFRLGRVTPDATVAIERLDRLRLLELAEGQEQGEPPQPIMVPLAEAALTMAEAFGRDMQRRQQQAGGLMRSAYGKARGVALRLSLVVEYLRWCALPGWAPPPAEIGADAFEAACNLVADYFMPMAERVYGDAAAPLAERNAATLAKWIVRAKAREVYVRDLQREVRLPGLRDARSIRTAADLLVEADWLRGPPEGGQAARAKVAYPVNPALWAVAHG